MRKSTKKQRQDAAKLLLVWLDTSETLATKTNAELVSLVEEHLWAQLPLGSPASMLLHEVMERLTPDTRRDAQ
jgi:hypothetical protein